MKTFYTKKTGLYIMLQVRDILIILININKQVMSNLPTVHIAKTIMFWNFFYVMPDDVSLNRNM